MNKIRRFLGFSGTSGQASKDELNETGSSISDNTDKKPTEYEIGEPEKKMFSEYDLIPSLNYHCGVKLINGLHINICCTVDENYEIINIYPHKPLSYNKLCFEAITEIKYENGISVEKYSIENLFHNNEIDSLYNIDILDENAIDVLLNTVCAGGNPLEVRFVLSKNPNVNFKMDYSGFSPLHSCVAPTDGENRQKIIELLYKAGADLDIKDDEKGLTALHYTAIRNKPLCAEALIKYGANINATEVNGATALHGAAFHGNIEVSKILLEAGANPRKEDNHGSSPISLASRGAHQELYNLLKQYS